MTAASAVFFLPLVLSVLFGSLLMLQMVPYLRKHYGRWQSLGLSVYFGFLFLGLPLTTAVLFAIGIYE